MTNDMPKYMELANWIQNQIETGELVPGQKMYSENKLSGMFGLSRQTVRHAIAVLEKEQMLKKVKGSGTYVKEDFSTESPAKRKRIAVIMTYLDGYIFPKTIRAIEHALFEQSYSVQIAFTNNLVSRERTILKDILEKDEVAGIIVETTKSALPNPNIDYYNKILEKKIKVIFINSFYPALDIPHVSMNDKKAGWLAANYLIQKGHRNITGIFKLDDGQGHQRYAGFIEAMIQADIPYDESKIFWIDTVDIKHIFRTREKIMHRLEGCSGVVTYNDEVAFELMKVLKSEGIRVPEDLSIVSVDDSELAVMDRVKLTSVPYPMEKLGELAVHNLLEMIHKPGFDGNYEFDVQIIERDSVKELNEIGSQEKGGDRNNENRKKL